MTTHKAFSHSMMFYVNDVTVLSHECTLHVTHTAHRTNKNTNEMNQPVTHAWIAADLCHSWNCSLMLFNEKLAVGTTFSKYNFSPAVMLFSQKQPAPSVFYSTEDTFISSN